MIKVVKFGGSSLASAEQFQKVGEIIRSDEERKYVIPSAPGRRFPEDEKVTDMLYACYARAEAGEPFEQELAEIRARYEGLSLPLSLEEEFVTMKRLFAERAGRDYAASRGEYLNGIVMAAYLGYEFLDAAEVICFDENGEFEAEKTNEMVGERLKTIERAVIPGFYGAYAEGRIKTFSRGGSDITGSSPGRCGRTSMKTGPTYPAF